MLRRILNKLEKAFEANFSAHLIRNRATETYTLWWVFTNLKEEARKLAQKKERLYKEKIKRLNEAIYLLENNNVPEIEYWLNWDILFFKYKWKMITFHTVWKLKAKTTNLVWDWVKHNIFPFKDKNDT